MIQLCCKYPKSEAKQIHDDPIKHQLHKLLFISEATTRINQSQSETSRQQLVIKVL